MGELSDALLTLNKEKVLRIVTRELGSGRDPLDLADEAREGLEREGQKFDSGEYFLMELMRGAQVFQAAATLLNPAIQSRHGGIKTEGKVLLGTVAGDIHDLGKNIVKILLECRGMEVADLGVDVPPEKFAQAIRQVQPDVVGTSALLTASIPQMKTTIGAITAAGLRDRAKIIVGGGIVGEVSGMEVRADHATTDANEGIKVIAEWVRAGSQEASRNA